MNATDTTAIFRKLNRALIWLRLLHGLSHLLKAMVVWCLLASFIRGRLGWDTVNLIAAASFVIFLARDFPSRRVALRRLEGLRPDSQFRFTTFHELARAALRSGASAMWETLRTQTAALLARPTPYLSAPGFAFSFRVFAAALSLTLVGSMVAPLAVRHTTNLPALLRVKLPAAPVRAGTDVTVQVFSEGRMSSPRLQVLPDDPAFGSAGGADPAILQMRETPGGFFETVLPQVRFGLRLTALADVPSGGRVVSPEARLRVVRPPVVAFSSMLVVPPAYSRLPAEEMNAVSQRLSVLPGTDLTLKLESDQPVSQATANLESERKTPPKIEWRDRRVEVKTQVRSPGRLSVSVTADNGLLAEPPFGYEIDTLPDRPPLVSWLIPLEPQMDAPVEGLVPMRWQIEDDFGFSSFALLITTPDQAKRVPVAFLPERRQSVSYLLDVTSFLSYAGSEIEIRAEAEDNDAINGPKRAASSVLRVRAPTVMDMYRNLAQQGADVSRIMERLSGESSRLLKKMTAATRTLKSEGKMAWQMEQELVNMAEAAHQAKRDAEKALAELGRKTESAARQNLLSRETLQKLSAIGSMMTSLMKEEYVQAQRELQRALGSVRMDEKERSMMTAKFNLEQFVEQVDRTHRMLSRMTDLLAQAEAHKAVQDLADRARQALDAKDAARLQSLQQEAAKLMPKLQELAKNPAFQELKKALATSAADLPKQFEQAANAMRSSASESNQEAAAKAAEEKLKNALAQLQSALEKGRQQSESSEKQNAAEKITTLVDVLVFSLGQMQDYHDYFRSSRVQRQADEYSRLLQKAAAIEPILRQAVNDVAATAEQLILFDPRPMQTLQRAAASIRSIMDQDEDPGAIAAKLKLAYRYTATAALQLLEITRDLQKQKGGSKGAPMQDLADLLQQLISAQSGLNSQTQMSMQLGMFGQSLEQLAFQQELIRRSMEAEAGRFSDLQDKLGRIDQLLQEMRKTEEELRKLGPTPDVQERQQKILNKLMELQHSLTEKEEKEEKFEAEPFFGRPSDTSALRLDRPKINEKEFLRGLPPQYQEAGKKSLRPPRGAEPQ